MRRRRFALMFGLASLLAGCVSTPPRPLAVGPDTHEGLTALKSDVAVLRLDPLKPIILDPSDGFSPQEVAVLAVLNDPDLVAKRAARGVAAAQVFQAGLLPDPQIATSFDHPVAGPDPLNAYSIAPSLDLAALITRSQTRAAVRLTNHQGDLDLLWAEWGAAQTARQQAETALAAQARQAVLRQTTAAAAERLDRSNQALANGDATLQTTTTDLAAKLDAETALASAESDEAKARSTLNGQLNLGVSVRLPLTPDPDEAVYDAAAIRQALAALPSRRPDLLALQAGYDAQGANLRAAILTAFPLTQIGIAVARDTAGSVTHGVSAAFALPLFNGSRGAVALQTATRDQLAAEYQARLDQATTEVQAAEGERDRARDRAARLAEALPMAETALGPARAAYGRGDLDSQAYLALVQQALTRRADLDDARLQARLAEIELETLLFLPPPTSRSKP
jgi:cobalt-zinc-cadmium efflux system outer membrane protein